MRSNRFSYLFVGAIAFSAACGGGGNKPPPGGDPDLVMNPNADLTGADLTGVVQDLTGVVTDGGTQPDLHMPKGSDGSVMRDLAVDPNADMVPFDVDAGLGMKCMSPPVLTITNGVGMQNVDTTLATPSTLSMCGGSGPENVYKISLQMAQKVTVVVTPDGNSTDWEPIVYLRKDCSDDTSEISCTGDANNPGDPATLVMNYVAAGNYFLYIDGYAGSYGAGTVKVTLDTAIPPPANDDCAGAISLDLTSGMAPASVDTTAATSSGSTNNGGGLGPDTVDTFTLTQPQKVTAVVTPDSSSATWDTVVSIRSTCADETTESACVNAANAGDPTTLNANSLPAGTYFLWVDGLNSTNGKGTLVVTKSAPVPGDDCNAPNTLTFTNGMATANVDTTTFVDSTAGTCGYTSSPDVVYKFTTTQAQSLLVTVTPDSSSTMWEPVVFVRQACADTDPTNEQVCGVNTMPGLPALTAVNNLPAGDWYIWVDGTQGDSGKGTLTAVLGTPAAAPTNENCTMPTAIALNGTAMGNTDAAKMADMGTALSTACDVDGLGEFPGNDVVYSFTPTASGSVTITLHPTTSWDPALWVMNTTCANDGAACTDAVDMNYQGGDEVITLTVTNAKPYFIVVDSWDPSAKGPFTLTVK